MNLAQIELLGSFRVLVDGQVIKNFPTTKVRALLAYLSVESDRSHERISLAGLFWPDWPDSIALSNLRKSLHRLRNTLAQAGISVSDQLFTISRQNIGLDTTTISSDVNLFDQLIASVEAHKHETISECEECLHNLEEAAELYRGDFLEGLSLSDAPGFDVWMSVKREVFWHQALKALDSLAEAYMQRGDYEKMHHFASRQITLDPYREEAYRQLMYALAKSGQEREAITQYENFRYLILKDLQAQPLEETNQLFERIQRGEFDAPTRFNKASDQSKAKLSALPQSPIILGDLPTFFFPLVGRDLEIQQIIQCLTDPSCSLLTLVGFGGNGKTHLMVTAVKKYLEMQFLEKAGAEALHNFPRDGVVYFRMREDATSGDEIAAVFARTLDLPYLDLQGVREKVLDYFKDRHCLVLWDNLEDRLVNLKFLSDILKISPYIRFVLTSHSPIHLRMERQMRISGLAFPEPITDIDAAKGYGAIQLFCQAARYFHPGFSLSENNLEGVIRLCQLVQGWPLAIEIAASLITKHSCSQIAEKIAQNPGFLISNFKDIPEPHHSIKSIFEHSWELLSTQEQEALAHLSIFPGSFDQKTAFTICEADPKEIEALADKSILTHDEHGNYEIPRFLRTFAFEKLSLLDPRGSALSYLQGAFCYFYLSDLANLENQIHGNDPDQVVELIRLRLDYEMQAIRWALEKDQFELVTHSLNTLGQFYELSGSYQDGLAFFSAYQNNLSTQKVHPDFKQERDALLARVYIWQAYFLNRAGQFGDAVKFAQTAQSLCIQNGDEKSLADSEEVLAEILRDHGEFYNARFFQQSAIKLYGKTGDLRGSMSAFCQMGILEWLASNYDRAVEQFQQALALAKKQNDLTNIAKLLAFLTWLYSKSHDLERAEDYLHDAASLHEKLHYRSGQAYFWEAQAAVSIETGDYEAALTQNRQSLEIFEELGNKDGLAISLGQRGEIFLEMGDLDPALNCLKQALKIDEELGRQLVAGIHLSLIGETYLRRGDLEDALCYCQQGYPSLRGLGTSAVLIKMLLLMTEIFLKLGEFSKASALAQESLLMSAEIGSGSLSVEGRILMANIEFAQGNSTLSKLFLEELLTNTNEETARAKVFEALWQITGEGLYAQNAIAGFRKAYQKVPKHEYKIHIEMLESVK